VGCSDAAELVCGFIGSLLEGRCYPLLVGDILVILVVICFVLEHY
jgi:hypothetical protein